MHRRILPAVFVTAAITVAGCSGEKEKEYTLPSSLCGIPTGKGDWSSFLPAGKEVTVQQATPNGGTNRCRVSVDGKVALVSSRIWAGQKDSVAQMANSNAKTDDGTLTDDSRYMYSRTGAVGRIEGCADPIHPEQALFSVIQVFASDVDGDAAAMKRLIASYTQAVRASSDCK
ncbi:hypothetical protein OG698_28340 [Streptomyces sp. NBC_01003]|uniref:hypothetical protein n=1 Tax=Streptomyces sp. NBC_01003 TaxID=2903714 RepID=UPI003864AF0E|nr:hypothetical protein OG698_28340 [Streptomyces sp. NBC_01003]